MVTVFGGAVNFVVAPRPLENQRKERENATGLSQSTDINSQVGKPLRSFLGNLIISTHFAQ
jgi:hypothetical protein